MDYSEIADTYDSRYVHEDSLDENRQIKHLLNLYVGKTDKVIDLGCGTGFAVSMIPQETDYIGLDISEEMIEQARKKYPARKFIVQDAEAREMPVGSVYTALFSIPYIGIRTIKKIASVRSQKLFIGVYYDKPYCNRDSVYYGHRLKFWLTVKPKVRRFIHTLQKYGTVIEEHPLTMKCTYRVIVVRFD